MALSSELSKLGASSLPGVQHTLALRLGALETVNDAMGYRNTAKADVTVAAMDRLSRLENALQTGKPAEVTAQVLADAKIADDTYVRVHHRKALNSYIARARDYGDMARSIAQKLDHDRSSKINLPLRHAFEQARFKLTTMADALSEHCDNILTGNVPTATMRAVTRSIKESGQAAFKLVDTMFNEGIGSVRRLAEQGATR